MKEGVRHVTTRLSTHQQSSNKKNIMLFSYRRSGSTWLMQSLAAEPGLRFCNEPLGPKFVHRSCLKDRPEFRKFQRGDKLIELGGPLAERIREYLENPKHTKLCGPYHPLKATFHLRTNRILFKLLDVNPVIDYFLKQMDKYQFVYLIRHPVSTILSCYKLPRMDLLQYIQSDEYRANHLSDDLVSFLLSLRTNGNEFELWAAEWALDQLAPWKAINADPGRCLLISYEQVLLNTESVVREVARRLELKRCDLILRELRIPSASTRGSRLGIIKRDRADELVSAWTKRVGRTTVIRIFDVISRFGIDYYGADSVVANRRYMLEHV